MIQKYVLKDKFKIDILETPQERHPADVTSGHF